MSGKIRLFWLILAVLFAGLACFACFYAGLYGSIYNQPDADPAETVTRFFESIRIGDYTTAYACLITPRLGSSGSRRAQKQSRFTVRSETVMAIRSAAAPA